MDSTTGGDANDEFARWLAETARAEQDAAQAQQPTAATPPSPPAQQPVAPAPQAPQAPAAPEFFGADELAAAPPTRPHEPQLGGPPVARSSYQPPADVPPAAPAPAPAAPDYVMPTVLPAEPAGTPSWAPEYTAPGAADPVAPAAPAQPAAPAFPDAPAATPFFPAQEATPAYQPPPSAAPVYTPPPAEPVAPPTSFENAPPPSAAPTPLPDYQAPVTSADLPGWGSTLIPETPATPPAAPPAETPTLAYQPPAAAPPTFDAPAYTPPVASEPTPPIAQQPTFPPADPVAPAAPPADPFGALFTEADDTAARLAASPPPSTDLPPLVSPVSESVPSDEDPMKSLFGLETEEQPAIRFDAAPEVPAAEPAAAAPPVYVPEPAAYEPAAAPPAAVPEQPYTPYTPEPVAAPEQPFGGAPAAVPEPAFAGAAAATSSGGSYALTQPGNVPADDDPNAGTQFFGGGEGEWEDAPDLDRSTLPEKVGLGLAILVPPVGLIAGIVNAVRSSRERGWVHRLVRVSLVVAVIMSIVAGFAGAYLYKVVDDARKHDAITASSAQFCAAVAADPSLVAPPSFGFPAPAATIPDTITSIQAYVDKWTALADVSPSGIRTDVNRVADSASGILDTVTNSRLVNDEDNQAVMASVAESTNIVGWSEEYCG